MKIAWLSDLHLNFVSRDNKDKFLINLNSKRPDIILIGGDISTSSDLIRDLEYMLNYISCPIYFVLGNHDYYGSSIEKVQEKVNIITSKYFQLKYLPQEGVVKLSKDTCLIGHDCWADGRYGAFFSSSATKSMNDYIMIDDFRFQPTEDLLHKELNKLGDEASKYLHTKSFEALESFRSVIVLTHVPPFDKCCWHEGNLSDKDYLPHFACKAAGDALLETTQYDAIKDMLVLSGHTHSSGMAQIRPNILARSAGSKYGELKVQEFIQIGD